MGWAGINLRDFARKKKKNHINDSEDGMCTIQGIKTQL